MTSIFDKSLIQTIKQKDALLLAEYENKLNRERAAKIAEINAMFKVERFEMHPLEMVQLTELDAEYLGDSLNARGIDLVPHTADDKVTHFTLAPTSNEEVSSKVATVNFDAAVNGKRLATMVDLYLKKIYRLRLGFVIENLNDCMKNRGTSIPAENQDKYLVPRINVDMVALDRTVTFSKNERSGHCVLVIKHNDARIQALLTGKL